MKLTKLYIHNYKSFYDTTIELDKMNIVVGENNSGKSNLIDVLEFVEIMASKDLNKAIINRGGFQKLFNYNYNEKVIFIELEFEDNLYKTVRRFRLSENLLIMSRMTYHKRKDYKLIPLGIISSRANFKLKKSTTRHCTFNKNIAKVTEDVSNISIFALHIDFLIYLKTYIMSIEKIRTDSQKESVSELLKDGSNLGKNLFHIKTNHPNTFELISNSMIGIVNKIDGLQDMLKELSYERDLTLDELITDGIIGDFK